MRSLNKIITRLSLLKSQVGYRKCLKETCAKISQKLFQPHASVTYSQFGEDSVIKSFFKQTENGFYVDVGCNEPISYSNTWLLYLEGWQGIAIDANPELIKNFNRVRPRDTSLTAAISDQANIEVEFYFSKESHLISGIGKKLDTKWKRTEKNCNIVKYQTSRLDQILEAHGAPSNFDFLNIDTEGNEKDVLISLNLDKYRPRLICVEIHNLDLSDINSSDIVVFLYSKNYRLIGYTKPSAFFCLDE